VAVGNCFFAFGHFGMSPSHQVDAFLYQKSQTMCHPRGAVFSLPISFTARQPAKSRSRPISGGHDELTAAALRFERLKFAVSVLRPSWRSVRTTVP